jgi:uncharacterized membrane protein
MIFAGNLSMCLMLFLTATGHFLFTKGMVMMLPSFIPFKTTCVYFTGILEMILGIALLFPSFRSNAGIILVAFFIFILPTNIYASLKHLNLEKADYSGAGPGYLWFRIPMQLFLIGWIFYFSI